MDAEFKVEYWEADEYVITMSGKGPIGQTLHKADAHTVARWLPTAIGELRRARDSHEYVGPTHACAGEGCLALEHGIPEKDLHPTT